MRKVKLIIHEKYAGKQNLSDVFAAVFLSDTADMSTTRRRDSTTARAGIMTQRSRDG